MVAVKYFTNFVLVCIVIIISMTIEETETRDVCRYSNGCYTCSTDRRGQCELYRYCYNNWSRNSRIRCLRYRRHSTVQDGCGIRPTGNIVGGSTSVEGRWPWQASLQLKSSGHFCGAVIINENWLLTAAHCLYKMSAYDYTAVLGEYDMRWRSGHEQYHSLSQTFVPGGNYPNDVGLVHLSSPIRYTDYIRPICLPSQYETYENDDCWISGWGATRGTGSNQRLRDLNVTLLDPNYCRHLWYGTIRPSLHICVNFGIKGACSGDSGGPLSCVRKSDGKFVVAGVTSWGDRSCQRYGFPSIYTNIKTYLPWIRSVISANSRGGK